MLLKRVGLPVLVVALSVLVTVGVSRLPPERVVLAAPAGEVTLTAPLQVPVPMHNIAPGDAGAAGAFRIGYAGNVPAWVGLDADLVGPLAGGSAPIAITIADGRGRYLARGSGQVLGLYQPGEAIDLAVAYAFPREAGNDYQALNADLLLRVYAVDATDNTRYMDGRPVGPISWSGRLPATAVTARENPESASGAAEQPCVGEGCAPEGATPVQPAVTAPAKPAASPAESAMTCCDCVRTLLWFGLLYAALLAVAMLAAFWAGWQLRERRFRQRLRRLRAK